MKKEDVLALCSTDAQKERVESVYMVAERFKKTPKFDSLTKVADVKKEIDVLVANYDKRQKSKAKNKERKMAKKATVEKFTELLNNANEAHIDNDDIIYAVKKVIKEKYNQEILNQIEELRKKMIE